MGAGERMRGDRVDATLPLVVEVVQPVSFETVEHAAADGILTITSIRPDRLNASTGQMRDDLIAAFDASDADDFGLRP